MSHIITRSKRVAAIILALAMVFALSSNAFAYENTVTAYVKLQTATVPDGAWSYNIGDLTGVTDITNGFVQVRVTKDGDITVKDIVNQFLEDYSYGVVECDECDEYGCDSANCEYGDCICTWKKVQNVDPDTFEPIEGSYASVLNSLVYDDVEFTNNGTSYYTDGTHGHYEGTSWEYFVTNCNNNQTEYPQSEYMDQYKINYSAYITLSFDTSSFDW